jgi:hypothetical protein
MATTCKLIAKNVLGSNTATVTFSSIPGTYDDLYLVISSRNASTADYITLRFNGSTSSYSSRRLVAEGASVTSATGSSIFIWVPDSGVTSNTFGSASVYIPNYSGSTNKSVSVESVVENNSTTVNNITVLAGLWSNTAAITEINLIPDSSNDFLSGSSFYLYGIKKA